tara:strand:- start:53 stop:487 length:435 start_codon:yes stop_codon:yes gene_type:complete
VVAPVVAAVAVAKLAYKPAMQLARKLAKKYWSKGADKKQIVQEVKDKGVLEKFNAFKLKAKPKSDVKPKSKVEYKSYEKNEKDLVKYAKRKNINVKENSDFANSLEAKQHIRANRPYEPRFKNARGGSVKKYAKGGSIRKANYK